MVTSKDVGNLLPVLHHAQNAFGLIIVVMRNVAVLEVTRDPLVTVFGSHEHVHGFASLDHVPHSRGGAELISSTSRTISQ